MPSLVQTPSPGSRILLCAGDSVRVTLASRRPLPRGKAFARTTIPPAASPGGGDAPRFPWRDIELERLPDGSFAADIPLGEPGVFALKALFVPVGIDGGEGEPVWPDGENVSIKVAPAATRRSNSIYTAFVRQFSKDDGAAARRASSAEVARLDAAGFSVIPPSGTFRELARRLDHIVGTLGFRIIQLLPIHPVPTTYARMGRFGSPFASTDFFSVDPALAEFDARTTPLGQFLELADAVHARGASIFLDIPANHTGWASTLQTHHPELFKRNEDGTFHSPGAWGVTWADLVELDFSNPKVADAIAEVFLFWCAKGVDGFRCDAGYMIPGSVWEHVTGRVRKAFPDTVFLLEGLGGKLEVTDGLIAGSGLDWAYSEIFQQYDRGSIEWYLGGAIPRSEAFGPLVNFAETHDNDRLAAKGRTYASMRTALSALLSQQGAWGITAGVEWFCRDKVDVHGAAPLNWGAAENQVALVSRLNAILDASPAFALGAHVEIVTRGDGNVVAALRTVPGSRRDDCLVAVNLDCSKPSRVMWPGDKFSREVAWDLVSSRAVALGGDGENAVLNLPPGGFVALVGEASALAGVEKAEDARRRRGRVAEAPHGVAADRPSVRFRLPTDLKRDVMVPPGHALRFECDTPFRVMALRGGVPFRRVESETLSGGLFHATIDFPAPENGGEPETVAIEAERYCGGAAAVRGSGRAILLPAADAAVVHLRLGIRDIVGDSSIEATLANRRGAAAQVAAEFCAIRSQYDALLAVNPDPAVPSSRQIFLTRCKAWLRMRGYSFALDATTQTDFELLSSYSARWSFSVPSTGGRAIGVSATLELSENANAARLVFRRDAGDGGAGIPGDVTLIVRPDVEARDFHSSTHAYAGPEKEFPDSVSANGSGFSFAPHGRVPCEVSMDGAEFHAESQWTYSVAHPVEARRGLEPDGDLFSPGWFSVGLDAGGEATLVAGECGCAAKWRQPAPKQPPEGVPFTDWMEGISSDRPGNALSLYLADRDENCTVVAGFPWFLDWGRDTLIVLRGLMATGRLEDSLRILRAFAQFEENGTLPNIIHGQTVGNRDTSDAPLWFVVAAGELAGAGVKGVFETRCGNRTIADAMKSIVRGYIAGTPNGVRADPASGLVFSPPHFTWMDTNYPAATPRAGYPVEIQALWIAALATVRKQLKCLEFADTEALARKSFSEIYPLRQGWLADCLRTRDGAFAPAREALPVDALRPNQLLAVTLGVVDASTALARSIVKATEVLLVPGGIRSLDDAPVQVPLPVWRDGSLLNDPNAPYWGHYEGDEDTRRKPAYHNGTAWCWQFPIWCEAFAMASGDTATALAYLASAAILASRGSIGQLPEILDGDSPHPQRGCQAQAWSVSEALRVWRRLRR